MLGNLCIKDRVTYMLRGDNLWVKKKLSKHIDMGSSFEDLIATSIMMKTDF